MRTHLSRAIAVLGLSALALTGCAAGAEEDTASSNGDVAADAAPLFDKLPEEVQEKGYLTMVGDSHPPYRVVEAGGKITGLDPDFQEMLAKQLGVELRMEISSGLPSILSGMLSGRYDAFNGPVRTTDEREAEFDAIVWLTTRTSYVFPAERADEFDSAEKLCGLRVAGIEGAVTQTQLERLNEWCVADGQPENSWLGLADTNATILAVKSDRADVFSLTQTAALDVQAQDPDAWEFLTQTDEQGAGVDLLAMFAPAGNGLGPVLFEAVQNMTETDEWTEFVEKWQLEDLVLDEPQYNPISGRQ